MKFLKRNVSFVITVAFCVGLYTSASASLFNQAYNQQNKETVAVPLKDIRRFSSVIAQIKNHYVEKIKDEKLFDNAIRGLLSNLDPHSAYLDENDLKDLEVVTVGKFGGIGIEIIPDKGSIKIVSPLDDTPAFKAGLKAGDYIVRIDSKLVKDMTMNEAIKMMRGPKGSTVTLTIVRPNAKKPIRLKIVRDIIKVQSVKAKLLEKGYAYIRIATFQEVTAKNLDSAFETLKKENGAPLKGLILDLRNNPGGLLDAAIDVSDRFIDADVLKGNKKIVYTKGRFEQASLEAYATSGEIAKGIPIVVLINEGSASASEIVAGALQDYKRAVVLGTKSFGKGSVQTVIPIDGKSAIKLTTALYYTPKGRSIQAEGIEPDVIVENLRLPKKEEEDILFDIRESDLEGHFTNGDAKKDNKEINEAQRKADSKIEKELAQEDFQLYQALNLLKGLYAVKKL